MKPERFINCVIAFSIFLTLLLSFSPFFYTTPLYDDYWRAAEVKDLGILESVKYEYLNWQGRWLGVGLVFLISSYFNLIDIYPLVLIILAIFQIFAFSRFISFLTHQQTKNFSHITLTLIVFALYWSGMPSVGQCFYYLSATIEYSFGLALSTILLTGLANYSKNKGQTLTSIIEGILILITAFLVSGLHELTGALLIIILVAGTYLSFVQRRSNRKLWFGALILSLISFLIVYFSPGNSVRLNGHPNAFNLTTGIIISIKESILAVSSWIFDVKLLAASYLFINYCPQNLNISYFSFDKPRDRIFTMTIWLIVLSAGFFIPGFVMGYSMPVRTLNGLYYIFILGWFFMLSLFSDKLQTKTGDCSTVNFNSLILLILAGSLIFTGNSLLVIRDYNGRFQSFHHAVKERMLTIKKADSGRF